MISYRDMTAEDVSAGLDLCRYNGWNQSEREWKFFLEQSPLGCRVAEDAGRVVGTVATIRYDNFSWIGMVLVDAAYQKQGIGRQLLLEGLHYLRQESIIKLDATPAGREVYLKLGFKDEYRLSRMQLSSTLTSSPSTSSIRTMRNEDIAVILPIDRKVFGAARKELIEWTLEGAWENSFVAGDGSEVTGYSLCRNGHLYNYLGPVIAEDPNTALQLVSTGLRRLSGPTIIDVPLVQKEFLNGLESMGFSEQRQLVRMYRGASGGNGIVEKQFGILGPEFG